MTAREQKKQVKDKKDPKEKEKKKKKNKEDKTIESPPKEKDKRKDEDPKQAVMKKKKKGSRTKEGKEKVTREDQSQMPTVSAPSTQSREDQVKVSTKWCDAISDKGVDQLVKEFKQINEQSVDMGSEKSENADKSRRKDLPCLEETRVKLDKDEFIHANYIQAICSSTRFIMTQVSMTWLNIAYICHFQHPLPHTMDTFWRMIHKERVDAIIMLNEVSADCPTYIPSAVGIARSFGEIKVTLNEQAPLSPEFPFIIQSKLQIQRKPKDENVKPDPKSDEYDKRKFKHLQWTNWPKNSVPEVSNALESLLTSIRNSSKPIVVHCTDGASRSGVVVLAELYFEAITMGQGSTDTADMLKRLREQRARAIGNEAVSEVDVICIDMIVVVK